MGSPLSIVTAPIKRAIRSTYRLGLPYVHTRNELPYVLNARGLNGEGVEIGVQRGLFSHVILSRWRGRRLYSVDPWREFSKEEYVDGANRELEIHEKFYRETINRMSEFGDRSSIIRATSDEAAPQFKDGQLDFVYIDAQHHYEAVKQDIELWRPKVRKGGVLAGHDYVDGHFDVQGKFGVKKAVDEFAATNHLRLILTHERDWPTWMVFV